MVINTDGLDWKRRKWGKFATIYLKFNYWLARKITNYLVSDSKELKRLYNEWYNVHTAFLTNGAKVLGLEDGNRQILSQYSLVPFNYYLVACRIEPENNIDIIVDEFTNSSSNSVLAIAGGASYESKYFKKLKKVKDPRVKFLGPVYEDGHIETLHLYSKGYIHGHEVGGTNPSLLKAMGCGNVILAHDVPFNKEVLGGNGFLWTKEKGSLKNLINKVDNNIDEFKRNLNHRCKRRIKKYYTWDKVAEDHERYFKWIVGKLDQYDDSF